MSNLSVQKSRFDEMNKLASKRSIVFFGSSYFSSFPFSELVDSFNINETVYNRSIMDLTIDDSQNVIESCVINLNPKRVFINLGEVEALNDATSVDDFISKYEWLLYTVKQAIKTDIYVVSIMSNSSKAVKFNKALKRLCNECGCRFIDISPAIGMDNQSTRVFDLLKHYIRTKALSFYDAMNVVMA